MPAARRKRGPQKEKSTKKQKVNEQPTTSVSLVWDVWVIICQMMNQPKTGDMYNMSLVSKSFNAIMTPILYNSLILGPGRSSADPESSKKTTPQVFENLVRRLLDDSNARLRRYVQVVTVLNFDSWLASSADIPFRDFILGDGFPALLSHLPNLRLVRFFGSLQIDGFPRAKIHPNICDLPGKPEIQLLGEKGEYDETPPQPLSSVSTLHAEIDRCSVHEARCIGAGNLLFECPNLSTLSLSALSYSQRTTRFFVPRPNVFLIGNQSFPPIRDLTLNGWQIYDAELFLWRDRFPWTLLTSLSLGPEPTHQVLRIMAGYPRTLKQLKVEAYAGEGESACLALAEFLSPLSQVESLLSLELRNYFCDMWPIVQHSKLVNLCVHNTEPWTPGEARRVLSVEDLVLLDEHCPNLETLDLDIDRPNDEWPWETIYTLATGFKNLRKLSLHVEVGIANLKTRLAPVFNYASAKEIGRDFYRDRWEASKHHQGSPSHPSPTAEKFPGRFPHLVLWSGGFLCRNPKVEPRRACFEENHTATFWIFPPANPGGEPEFHHLQRWELDAIQKPCAVGSAYYKSLQRRVEAVVEGPKPLKGKSEGSKKTKKG
ncbi:hypothetical protein NUU61_006221 [Penicillium alfredii]|uniref:F-box domain-containing protein n=1 Tax=Penicillium alfredii TaxID=1506179 RepID=A0A9W9K3J3_9EURO|nr:uncharacterized protein NUU61_006221 [Penicillium alfredii]KAJ5091351.1 hypothetical protein NUU61_006221 [Penicillium alfredii]